MGRYRDRWRQHLHVGRQELSIYCDAELAEMFGVGVSPEFLQRIIRQNFTARVLKIGNVYAILLWS